MAGNNGDSNRKARVLVIGNLDAGLDQWFLAKVDALNRQSGPFACVLVTAGVDGATTTQCQSLGRFPVPLLFAAPSFDDADAPVEVPECNVSYVGPAGLRIIDGLAIVMLAASDPPASSSDPVAAISTHTHTVSDEFQGIDLLITGALEPNGTVATLGARLRPQFHFCGHSKNTSFRESTFVVPGAAHSTRLLTLVNAVKGSKEKWIYATAVAPLSRDTPVRYNHAAGSSGPCPYIARTSASHRNKRKRTTAAHPRLDPQADCWFCLENGKDLHLVATVGKNLYVALAKGALTPYHVLMIPVNHLRSSLEAPLEVLMEIQKFKLAVKTMFATRMNSEVVFMERCVNTSGGKLHNHGHIHAVPVPRGSSGAFREILEKQAGNASPVDLVEVPQDASIPDAVAARHGSADEARFFWVEHSGGYRGTHVLKDSARHPLEFGRHALANLLGKVGRSSWRDCVVSTQEETIMANKFRKEFENFVPNI